MNKAEKKFRIYAIIVIFVLLTMLLAVINGVNFTMAANDADMITQMLANRQGSFEFDNNVPADMMPEQPKDRNFRMGPMGPDSPEMNASLRYFTIAFSDKVKTAETVAFNISAITESEAQEWAKGLLNQSTGWTKGTYRYRVYKDQGVTYVTVIDQGRELLPSFRILIISAAGGVICLITAWFVLLFIGRKIYAPIEEADRKQKNFIKSVNREFRLPLTVIGGNTELTERERGPDDRTRSTRRQLTKLNELVDKLGTVGIFDNKNMNLSNVPLSEFLCAELDRQSDAFAARNISVTYDIAPDVTVSADPGSVKKMIDELVLNSVKYSLTKASFSLKNENGVILMKIQNDTDLPNGQINQIFDRFTVLDNAKEDSAGLGLSYVKEAVKAHNGRVYAEVADKTFTLRVTL